MKKLVSLILSMVMVIGFAPQASFAAPGGIGGLWELVNLTTEGENGTTVSEGDEIYFDDELTAKYKLTFPPDDGIIVDDGNDYIEEIVMPTNLVLSDSDGEHEISVDEDGTAIPLSLLHI